MIFQGLSHNMCLAVSEDASRCMGSAGCYRGRRTSASKDDLPAQHNVRQGLVSARVVPAVCVWGGIFCKAQPQDWTNSQQWDASEAAQGSL